MIKPLSPTPRALDMKARMSEIEGVSVTLGPLVKLINETFENKSSQEESVKIFDEQLPSMADRLFSRLPEGSSITREMIEGKMTHFLAFYGIQALFTSGAADETNTQRKQDFLHEVQASARLPRAGDALGSSTSHPDRLLSSIFPSPLGFKGRAGIWNSYESPKSDDAMFEAFKSAGRSEWWINQCKFLLTKLHSSVEYGVLGTASIPEHAVFAYFAQRMKAGLTTVTTDGHLLADYVRRPESETYVRNYLKQKGVEAEADVTSEMKKIVVRSLIALHPVALTSISVHRAVISQKQSDFIFEDGDIGRGERGLYIVSPELKQMKRDSGPLSEALKKALGHGALDRGTDPIACGCPLAYSPLMREAMKTVCDQLFK